MRATGSRCKRTVGTAVSADWCRSGRKVPVVMVEQLLFLSNIMQLRKLLAHNGELGMHKGDALWFVMTVCHALPQHVVVVEVVQCSLCLFKNDALGGECDLRAMGTLEGGAVHLTR